MPQQDNTSTQAPLPDVGGGQQGARPGSLTGFIQQIANFHQAKQAHAASELDRALRMNDAGFPMDPGHMLKLAKKSGLPVITGADATALTNHSPQGGQQPSPKAQGGQPQSKEGGGPDPNAAKYDVNSIKDPKERAEREKELTFDGIIRQRAQNGQLKGENENKTLQLTSQMLALKSRAMEGDKQAIGQLMQLGEINPDIKLVEWQAMSDKQRGDSLDILAGHESSAQFEARTTNIADSMVTSGKFKDPAMAAKAARVIAAGGDLTPEMKSAMVKNTPTDLANEAKLANELVNLGVPANQVGKVARAASLGGLENALPTGIKPVILQQLALQKQQVGLEGARVGLEQKRIGLEFARIQMEGKKADEMAKKMELAAKTEADKATLEQFMALVDIKKAGGTVPKEILSAMSDKVAGMAGLEMTQVNDWFHFVTGGTHGEWASGVDHEAVSAGAGRSQTAPPQQSKPNSGIMSSVHQGIKKTRSLLGEPN